MAKLLAFRTEEIIQQWEGFCGAAHAAEHHRQIGARGMEIRSDLQCAPEQRFRIAVATDPRRQFREHADGARIERVALEIALEQPLRDVQAVGVKRVSGFDQQARELAKGGQRRCCAAHGEPR